MQRDAPTATFASAAAFLQESRLPESPNSLWINPTCYADERHCVKFHFTFSFVVRDSRTHPEHEALCPCGPRRR